MRRRIPKVQKYEMPNWTKEYADLAYKLEWKHVPDVKYTGSIADRDRFYTWYMRLLCSMGKDTQDLVSQLYVMIHKEKKDIEVSAYDILERLTGERPEQKEAS